MSTESKWVFLLIALSNLAVVLCNDNCGLIVNRNSESQPWHVAVYTKQNRHVDFTYICGGTLISAQHVISAAHCFWNRDLNTLHPPSDFQVAVGKVHHALNHSEDDSRFYVQKSMVTLISTPLTFIGFEDLRSDISILKTKKLFHFSDNVHPVCLDLTTHMESNDYGAIGKLSGWVAYDSEISDRVRTLSVPLIDAAQCANEFRSNHFIKFLTIDKFCAGDLGKPGVCRGDGGGGLTVHKADIKDQRERWYLKGVASIGFSDQMTQSCRIEIYALYTSVSVHKDWIKEILDENI